MTSTHTAQPQLPNSPIAGHFRADIYQVRNDGLAINVPEFNVQ